jgi:4'-phosphopantetheinyl transferase
MSAATNNMSNPVYLNLDALRSEIHVLPAFLDDTHGPGMAGAPSQAAWNSLSTDEAARALAFTAPHARNAFVLCRALLRRLLGDCLKQPPSSLVFERGDFGKPSLATYPDLCFNVSHSGALALLAFTFGLPIGVDIERQRPMPNALKLANRFFSPQESAAMRSHSGVELDRAFLTCWTRKEAAVKALGLSLDGQLASFSVPAEPMPMPCHIEVSGSDLTLHSISLAPHAFGALAHAGPSRPLRVQEFQHAASMW